MAITCRPALFAILCVGLAGLGSRAHAEDVQRAPLRLIVNQQDKGEVIVLVRGSDVWIRVADLEQAGLHGVFGQRALMEADAYLSLGSLAPAVVFELDERELVLRLTAAPALLGAKALDFGVGRPPGIVYRQATSAFLNYAVSERDFSTYSAFAEAGLSFEGALLFGSAQRNEDGSIVRGLSNLTIDDRPRLVRWVLGDRFARSDALGGALLMGGVSASREFSIDPYFRSFPTIELFGTAATPSTVDVYVNGALVRQQGLGPGTFELKNLPAPAGRGAARVVVRDAFGREQEIVRPFYLSTALLAEGLHDFTYHLGYRRDNLGTESWDYHRPALLARHRVGLTDTLTTGIRLEAASELVSGGPTLGAGLPFGEIELTIAGSQQQGSSGAAAHLAYAYLGRSVSFGASVRGLSDHYATLSLAPRDDRPTLEASAFTGVPLTRRADLTLQYTHADFRDRGQERRGSAFLTVHLTDRAILLLNASRLDRSDAKPAHEAFLALSVYLGERTTGTLSTRRSDGDNAGTIDVQRSLPVGTGFGYRVQAETTGEVSQGTGVLQYQGRWGRYEARYQNTNGSSTSALSAAGGVLAIGGAVFATRPVTDSFALIRVPGVENVRGYLDNHEIGRTNPRGDLPVPDLLAYYGNRLGIAAQDIPLEYSVGATEQTVATPLRGGALVTFPARPVRAVSGSVVLVVAGEPIIPAYGQLTVTAEGRASDSPIGRGGEFYLDDVPMGRHQAVIEHGVTRCSLTLEVPTAPGPVIDVGRLRCVAP